MRRAGIRTPAPVSKAFLAGSSQEYYPASTRIAIHDQSAGEERIVQAMTKRPRDFRGWTAVAGAYLGVVPML